MKLLTLILTLFTVSFSSLAEMVPGIYENEDGCKITILYYPFLQSEDLFVEYRNSDDHAIIPMTIQKETSLYMTSNPSPIVNSDINESQRLTYLLVMPAHDGLYDVSLEKINLRDRSRRVHFECNDLTRRNLADMSEIEQRPVPSVRVQRPVRRVQTRPSNRNILPD